MRILYRIKKLGLKPIFIALLSLVATIGFSNGKDTISDSEIKAAVQHELLYNATTSSFLINVEVHEGIVTLTGSADNLLANDRAVQIARMVRGVRGVVDNIGVVDADKSDRQLGEDVQQALLYDPATEAFEINATVNNGIVTLEGTVDSWQEKKIADYVVKSVEGVMEIKNNVLVDYAANRTDTEMETEIEKLLRNDVRVDDGLIDVTVNNSRAFLSGTVGSANEKYQARAIAWVTGITDVNISNLKVKEWARNERLRENKYIIKSDKEIREAVEDVFIYDPRVFSFNPVVQVDDGVVTLTGTVSNLKAKHAAEEDAKNVVGVFSVRNNLTVSPAIVPKDSELEEDVIGALLRDPYIDSYEVKVEANNGVVRLEGDVDTQYEKMQAEEVASRAKGVVEIENNLNVDRDFDAYYHSDYGWNSYYPPNYLNVNEEESKTDWEIKEDIESQLWWSPYVNEDEITVYVIDGKATLTGTVDTQREKLYAEINAVEGGAELVENKLEVAYLPGEEE